LWATARLRGGELVGDVQLFNERAVVLEIDGLRLQHASRELVRSVLPHPTRNGFYQIVWQAAASAPRDTRGFESERWLILADRHGVAEALRQLLESRGAECMLLQPGADPTAFAGSWHGAVYLSGLDATSPADQEALCGGALDLLQALASAVPRPPRVWMVTAGAQSGAQPAQSTLWGLGRTVRIEQPEIWGGLVDLDAAAPPARQAHLLLTELYASENEREVAYHAGQRHVARLVRAALPPPAPAWRLRRDGAYLITGGCGALGLQVAQRMAARGAGHLVLMGRREPTAGARVVIQQLRESGANVLIVTADVSRERAVADVLTQVAATLPPLRGIVHAAGVLDDGMLPHLTWSRFESVLAPKVLGAWNLHTQTRGLPLDFFVLFSSLASVMGSPGQANYAAANAFLDSLARHRREMALPALSVNWPAWAEVGMAAERSMRSRPAGLSPILPEQGLDALEMWIGEPGAQIAFVAADWPRFLEQAPQEYAATFLAHLETQPDRVRQVRDSHLAFREQLRKATGAKRDEVLMSHVREQVMAALGLPPAAPLNPNQGFFDLGMDSLMATEIRNRLQDSLDVPLPATVMLEYASLSALAAYLGQALFPTTPETAVHAPAGDDGVGTLLDEIESLSEDEIDRELAAWTTQQDRESHRE
jgi:NAD(P)-dependent dehydrogenase (short-subunit alcohol dehydrogenase family)/acyl carrier protein